MEKLFLLLVATAFFVSCDQAPKEVPINPKIESIMLASKVLKGIKKKKEVKNDLLSNMAPPIIQSCSTTSSFDDLLALDDIHF